jgi:hypothetical protein
MLNKIKEIIYEWYIWYYQNTKIYKWLHFN